MKIIDLDFQDKQNIIASFLIEAKEPILIETGPDSTFEHLTKHLQHSGLSQKDIKHVFVTHIHLDHSGAAWHFAKSGAKIYVHPNGAKHLIDPARLVASAKTVYKDKLKSLFGDLEPISKEQIIVLNDEEAIDISGTNIIPIFTPGHAKHHACFFLDDHMFTGDEGGIRILDGPIMPPMPPPDINLKEWVLSIEKLKKYAPQFICPTHFGCFKDDTH
ncbi:MAG: MBL fold metallo-hydrolase, partial [Desulfurella sp.]